MDLSTTFRRNGWDITHKLRGLDFPSLHGVFRNRSDGCGQSLMDLSVITVNWKVKDLVFRSLQSLYKHTSGISFEVFFVDNDSRDGSVELIQKELPQVRIIANQKNLGFAKACNQGIRQSSGEFVLLLNPDMRVEPYTLSGMVLFMRDPRNKKVGIAGCRLVDENGATIPHVRRFPGFPDQLAVMLKIPHLFPRVLDYYMMRDFDYTKEAEVDSIRGSFFMIRRSVLEKIGLLDEGFFAWFEEVDFCKRAHDAGFTTIYTPTMRCLDYIGQSFKQVRLYPKQKIITHSMCYYFKKHAPIWQWMILLLLRPCTLAAAWVADKWNIQGKNVT